jgi:radical SAM protein with 4Fe4S-binding SPASM domain
MSSPWVNRYHRASIPYDLLEQVRAYVLSVNETLEQHPPSKDELNRAVGRAVGQAGSVDRLHELASSGRLAEVTEIRPFNLEMDLLNKCNLRCPMCMMSHPSHYKQPLQRMSLEVFERLAAEVFWHVNALSFTFGAEPLLHPEFPRFVEIASRYRIPKVYAVTNGTLLTDAIARAIVTHGMDVLAVSLDAARPETYRQIRVGGNWDRLMHNLHGLERIKREFGSPRPHLELTFVMMKTNIGELPEFVDLAARLGATTVNATHMLPFESLGIAHESCSLIKETTNEMLSRARARARKLGLRFTGPPSFGKDVAHGYGARGADNFGLPVSQVTQKAGHCPFPWHFAAIDMFGDVVPCGWWHNQPGMGSIGSESFLSIWRNTNYRKLRAEHESGALCATCSTCPAAGMGPVDCKSAFLER